MLSKVSLVLCVLLVVVGSALGSYRDDFPLPTKASMGTSLGLNVNNLTLGQTEYDAISSTGAKWVRLDIDWSSIQGQPGWSFHFEAYDAKIAEFTRRGIRVIGILHASALPWGNGWPIDLPAELSAYQTFVATTVQRYRRLGVLWEVWNEPNSADYWHGSPNADLYMAVLNAAADALRSVAPDEYLIGPALGKFDMTFMRRCLDLGLLNQVDAVTVHPYGTSPEASDAAYDALTVLVAQKSPAGKSIPIYCGEFGYDWSAPGATLDIQAQYVQRQLLTNLVRGIPLSVWFNFQDFYDANMDDFHPFGLYDSNLLPRPADLALDWLTATMDGWTYRMRLSMSSPDDYVLVFSSGTRERIVAWTTSTSHSVSIGAIPGTAFSTSTYKSTSRIAASSKLKITFGSHPQILTPETDNANLSALAAWAALPATCVIANRQDCADQLLPVITGISSAGFPTGTQVSVRDTDFLGPLWKDASKSWTFTDISTLTNSNASVTAMLNDFPRIQDRLDEPHTVLVKLTLPGGATVSQTSTFHHRDPIHLAITPSLANQLWINLEIPSGRAMSGKILVEAGYPKLTTKQTIGLNTAPGQTEAAFSFPSITTSLIEQGVRITVYDSSNNLVYPTKPIAATNILSATHFAPPAAGLMSVEVGGDPSVAYTYTAGPATGRLGGIFEHDPVFQLDYTTGKGLRYFNIQAWSDPAMYKFRSPDGLVVGMWVYGDNSNAELSTVLRDESDQRFKLIGPRLDWNGWRRVDFTFGKSPTIWWGGANNGIPQGNVRVYTPLVVDNKTLAGSSSIQICGLLAIGVAGK